MALDAWACRSSSRTTSITEAQARLFAAGRFAHAVLAVAGDLRDLDDRICSDARGALVSAYSFIDHTYDVVVVGAGGAGLRADVRAGRGGAGHRLHHQGIPDAQPHGRGAGRHQRRAGQHGRRRLALAHVRHRQGVGLARRPGRDRVHVQGSAQRGDRARTLRRAVLAHRDRADLSAAVRRHDDALRQGHGAAHLRGRGSHRPRDVARAVPAVDQARGGVLRRILRHRSDHGWRGMPRRGRAEPRRRHVASFPRPQGDPGNGWLRPHLFLVHLGAHLHRRRRRDGVARGPAAAGHGVRAIPSHRHLRRGLPDHRGGARGGRLPHQCQGRALHGTLRAQCQGSRLARRREPLDDRRDPRGPRRRHAARSHPSAPGAPGARTSSRSACRVSPRPRASLRAST